MKMKLPKIFKSDEEKRKEEVEKRDEKDKWAKQEKNCNFFRNGICVLTNYGYGYDLSCSYDDCILMRIHSKLTELLSKIP